MDLAISFAAIMTVVSVWVVIVAIGFYQFLTEERKTKDEQKTRNQKK